MKGNLNDTRLRRFTDYKIIIVRKRGNVTPQKRNQVPENPMLNLANQNVAQNTKNNIQVK